MEERGVKKKKKCIVTHQALEKLQLTKAGSRKDGLAGISASSSFGR